jgi:hypothetical protein
MPCWLALGLPPTCCDTQSAGPSCMHSSNM